MNIDQEVLDAFREKENQNGYKYKLLFEYRDIIIKRERLEQYIINNEDKTKNENELKKFQLLKEQLEILYRYEDILCNRLRLELTIC